MGLIGSKAESTHDVDDESGTGKTAARLMGMQRLLQGKHVIDCCAGKYDSRVFGYFCLRKERKSSARNECPVDDES